MSWHFRKSFKVIPGLRLNLSRSGLSASIGGAPFTVNVGPRGLTSTLSIPGTGVSIRRHLGANHRDNDASVRPSQSKDRPIVIPTAPEPKPSVVPDSLSSAPIQEVRSASTELLSSDSLKELKALMQMTFEERTDITRQLDPARFERERAIRRYESWQRGFLLKRLFKNAFAKRKTEFDTATAKVAELEEQLRLTIIATQVEIEKEQAEPYCRMRDDFASLCECAAIWDVKSHQATDRFHERTSAVTKVERQRVNFLLDNCDLLQWEQKVPHLKNAKGGDIYLYPGFILYRASRQAFSVVDYHDVNRNAIAVQFHEVESVPADSKVIDHTWAKANKDGSRDRRFADNHQVPIAVYGAVTFKSNNGLWEEFHFSDPGRLTRFLKSFDAFVSSFGENAKSATA